MLNKIDLSLNKRLTVIVSEGVNTLIDLPFLLLLIPVLILTPYKLKCLYTDLKTHSVTEWRSLCLSYLAGVFTDIPYILMLLFILASVFMAFKLRSSLRRR